MVAPFITDFGDEVHEIGETGLTVSGFEFFPGVGIQGELWMFANADRSGASDQLTIGTHTNNSIPGVSIPGSPNNSAGTVYLAFRRGGDLAWSDSYTFTLSSGASAAVSGTLLNADESDIVTGGNTLIITLTDDTWVAAGATFDAQRQNIINGVTSAQSETTGWNNEVRDNEVVGSVVRTSDTVVTITWSASASYDITANETITVTVPATALTGAQAVVATPTVTVTVVLDGLQHNDTTLRHNDTTLRHLSTSLRHNSATLRHNA